MTKILSLISAVSLIAGCAGTIPSPVTLRHFQIESAEDVVLTVRCDGRLAYMMEVGPGNSADIGGPEALCTFVTDKPADLRIEPVWK